MKRSRMAIFISGHEKLKKHLRGGISTENDFGLRNSVFGISNRLEIVHPLGTISRLWQGISHIAFTSPQLKRVKMSITPFRLMNSTILFERIQGGCVFLFFKMGNHCVSTR